MTIPNDKQEDCHPGLNLWPLDLQTLYFNKFIQGVLTEGAQSHLEKIDIRSFPNYLQILNKLLVAQRIFYLVLFCVEICVSPTYNVSFVLSWSLNHLITDLAWAHLHCQNCQLVWQHPLQTSLEPPKCLFFQKLTKFSTHICYATMTEKVSGTHTLYFFYYVAVVMILLGHFCNSIQKGSLSQVNKFCQIHSWCHFEQKSLWEALPMP